MFLVPKGKENAFLVEIKNILLGYITLNAKCNNAEKSNHKVFIVMTRTEKKYNNNKASVELHRGVHIKLSIE